MEEQYEAVRQAAAALESALNALPHPQNVEVVVKHPQRTQEETRCITGSLLFGCGDENPFVITVTSRPQPRRIYP